jgi:RimJ/RimL family protein N-acetyltransferase
MQKIIETERLYLREMTEADLANLAQILQDKEVMYAYDSPFTEQQVKNWYNRLIIDQYTTYGFGLWAVIHKDSGNFLGQCGLTMQKVEDKDYLEIGYLFKKQYWHKGYATEAALACKNYAFSQLKAPAVYSIIRDNNFASRHVAERAGMVIVNQFIKHYSYEDVVHYIYKIKNDALQ